MAENTISRRSVGLRSERGPILLSLMLATSLVALDSTIIATASTSIAKDLGGFAQIPWLFSIYVLAQAVSVPIYGRLADFFGRKHLMLIGIGLFFVGSIVCGFAWSMPVLIVSRVIQGLGAGAVLPMSMTIASDIYTLEERAKTQGYLASVWGIAAIVGPTLGGVFSEFVSWRWIFFINIPLSLLAAWMLWRRFTEKGHGERVRPRIDYAGAVLLTAGTALVILGLLEGGTAWTWNSAASIVIFVAGGTALVAFVFVERAAQHPILPLGVLRRRVIWASTLASLIIGAIVLGLSTYIPIYAQNVLGVSALVAGFALAAQTVGWPLTSSIAGRFYLRLGFRSTSVIGASIVTAGALLLLTLGEHSSIWFVGVFCFVIGAGMGLTAVPTLIAAQTAVGWQERGMVTGTNMFARSIGSAVGVAVFGAIVNANTKVAADGTPYGPQLATAAHLVFAAIALVALVLLAAVLLMPTRRAQVIVDEAADDVPARP
ncbi:MDR family MFS transporter [Humibacter albus]|uniref:MDR family MFS transporter n=1 Tax=Humibacter albus TaxID=427754 RepID=UPI0003B34524|nr:MDR family MFS transporter [Humibacter albus]